MTPAPERVRVLIADGQSPSRAGLRAALEDGGVHVVAEAGDTREAVAQAQLTRPQVTLIAADLPGGALPAVHGILEHLPSGDVVILAEQLAGRDAHAALMAGASGYVQRDVDPERIPDVVRAVAAGEVAVPRSLVATLLREVRMRGGPVRERLHREHNATLTDREWEVLALLDDGLRTAEIADRLGVSPVTVRRHVGRLLARLGVADSAAALLLLRSAKRSGAP